MTLRPDPRPDLLAAHSMDSVWFVVDADGEVFAMSTGEPGAMPSSLPGQDDASYNLARIIEALHQLPAVVDAVDDPTRDDFWGEFLVFTDGSQPPGDALPVADGVWAWSGGKDDVTKLRAEPGFRKMVPLEELEDWGAAFAVDWCSAQFVYEARPAPPPLRWTDLPREARERVAYVEVARRLRGAERFDLLEHFGASELQTWGELGAALAEIQADTEHPSERYARRRYWRPDPDEPAFGEWVLPEEPPSPARVVPANPEASPQVKLPFTPVEPPWWRRWTRALGLG